jgi:hypothetical protein
MSGVVSKMADMGLMEERHFQGTLSHGANAVAVAFTARVDCSGTLVIGFDDVPSTPESRFLINLMGVHTEKVTYLILEGEATDGTKFHSEHLLLTTIGHKGGEDGYCFPIKGRCSKAVLERQIDQPADRPTVVFWLRGTPDHSDWHGPLQAISAFGEIAMSAVDPAAVQNPLTHILTIKAPATETAADVWRPNAETFLHHVRWYMSFAMGVTMEAPVWEFRVDKTITVTVFSRIPDRGTQMAAFRWHEQGQFLKVAAQSYPVGENLVAALSWFLLSAVYTAQHLIHAMTALENLVDVGLTDEEKRALTPAEAGSFIKVFRKLVKDTFGGKALSQTRDQLYKRSGEFERRTFICKLTVLLEKLGVPYHDIGQARIKLAIEARNAVVHAGVYEDEDEDKADLWDHAMVIRELVIRIVFRSVGYEGHYTTHLGGWSDAVFPPPRSP